MGETLLCVVVEVDILVKNEWSGVKKEERCGVGSEVLFNDLESTPKTRLVRRANSVRVPLVSPQAGRCCQPNAVGPPTPELDFLLGEASDDVIGAGSVAEGLCGRCLFGKSCRSVT